MRRFSIFFYKKSSLWIALVLTGLMILYASIIMSSKSECFQEELDEDTSILALKFAYTLNDAEELFILLSEEAKKCYHDFLAIWDSVFPLFYASMYIFWLSLIYKNISKDKAGVLYLNLYPLIPMVLDWLENYWEIKLLSNFSDFGVLEPADVKIGSLITQAKWIFSSINYIIILTGIILLIRYKFNRKNQ